jgi:hypothetical protein
MDRMPANTRIGREVESPLDYVLHMWRKTQEGNPSYLVGAERQVLGLGLPSWQRPLVWNDAQCQRFIQSIWTGVPLGFWMLNTIDADAPHQLEALVIDGQQRLHAIERYVTGDLIVPARDGTPLVYADLTVGERRRFGAARFPHINISVTDEAELQAIYDRLNFGGVAHTPEQMAVGKPQDTAPRRSPRPGRP